MRIVDIVRTMGSRLLTQWGEQTHAEIAAKAFNAEVAAPAKSADVVIVQIDGSMVPTVEYGEVSAEQKAKGMKRKRECLWKEFRLVPPAARERKRPAMR